MKRSSLFVMRIVAVFSLMSLFAPGAVIQTGSAQLTSRKISSVDAEAHMDSHDGKGGFDCNNVNNIVLDEQHGLSKHCKLSAKGSGKDYGFQAWIDLDLHKNTRVAELAVNFSVTVDAHNYRCYKYAVKGWQHVNGWEDKEITYRDIAPVCDISRNQVVSVGGENKQLIIPIKDNVYKLQVWVQGSGGGELLDPDVKVYIEFFKTIPYAYSIDSTSPTVEFGVAEDGSIFAKVQDTGSGLREVSVNCKSWHDPFAKLPVGEAIDVNVPAFAPGTNDPLYVKWLKSGGITDNIECGVYAPDLAGNPIWCPYKGIGSDCK